ncbi:TM2 domain-containing protein [Massilia sp. PAMC28688]|uniref:NINE protein n=1 Tax=Massilia sp. PAMC28688 TaxID=2861283 RepID=UPI001C631F38|nr:NINE protein [Massilia sp. PAMC28688]QYF94131.1 TM2 domain-containing protein [Massilia sp. PAMC28688]
MPTIHKNKTFATFLALTLGGLGVHRFYLRGPFDKLGMLHAASVPVSGLVIGLAPDVHGFYQVLPVLISYVVGFLEALIVGLTPDEKFDASFNAGSGKTSASSWILAVLLVTTMLVGTTALIATMSRLNDLLYTSGSFG